MLFLDRSEHVGAGDELRATGRVASVVASDEVLGRVVDALGRPIDDGPPLQSTNYWPVERQVPGVIDRQPVRKPTIPAPRLLTPCCHWDAASEN